MPGRQAPQLLQILFPGRCIHCHLATCATMDLCSGCQADLAPVADACPVCAEPMPAAGICGHCLTAPPAFSRVIAPYVYRQPLDHWIFRFKQKGDLRTGKVLGTLLARHLKSLESTLVTPDLIVPAPLHWRRRFFRGFNQSHEIARIVADQLQLPLHPRLLKRTRATARQQYLKRRERLKNLQNSFTVHGDCTGLDIAVVDDVVTTASTARTISSTLMAAGARSVQIWAVGRTALEK